MKKTIFTILVILTILLFTGCDPILEALYPNSKIDGGDGGNNVINVRIELGQGLIDYQGYKDLPKINVKLQKDDGFGGWIKPFPEFWDFELWDMGLGYPSDTFIAFEYLPPGTYRVVIYWDNWWNGEFDYNEQEFNVVAGGTTYEIPDPPPPEGVYIETSGFLDYGHDDLGRL